MSPRLARAAGAALLAMLAIHPMLRPEGGWALLSTCDLAAFATALGLLAGRPRWVTTALVFQASVGLPALAIGILTTYRANATGVAIHIVPLALGWLIAREHGISRRSALVAWAVYAISIPLAAALAPTELNINFAAKVWPPLAGSLTLPMFQACLIALVGILLAVGELALRRALRRPS